MTPRPAARFRRLTAAPPPDPDGRLLAAFLADRSEPAFAELVRRHGPLVYGVCRRVLGHAQDAEDAFQATFLVLARKAGSVTRADTVSPWLYAVAVRTARELRHMRDRRRKHERLTPSGGRKPPECSMPQGAYAPRSEQPDPDLAALLDEELAKLPDHYRRAVVLCELQGRPRKAAAAELGIPEGTLSSRLAAARKLLAARLTRRGVTATAATVAAVLATEAAARVPSSLLTHTTRAVAAGIAASPLAAQVADGVVKALFVTKLKGLTVALGVAAVGFGGVLLLPSPGGPGPAAHAADGPAKPAPADDPAALVAQLGSPAFADREAAEKKLRAMGATALPAVNAGRTSPDPEIARRAAGVRDVIRDADLRAFVERFAADATGTAAFDHPVWVRFKTAAGDTPASRGLFAAIVADPGRLRVLAAAADDPAAAAAPYRDAILAHAKARGEALAVRWGRWGLYPDESGYLLYLGTFPSTARAIPPREAADHESLPPWEALRWKDGWPHDHDEKGQLRLLPAFALHPLAIHPPGGRVASPARPAAASWWPAVLRLAAAWWAERGHESALRSGLDFVLRHVGRDAVPVARRLAADPTRPAVARCYALIVLGRLGAAGDLPDLTPFLTDRTSVFDWKSGGPAGRVSYSAQVRDVAAFVGLKLSGRDPAAFGFPPRHDGPWFLTFGFADDAAREAAHAKAGLPANPPAPADDSAALVRQLGNPAFADREAAEKALRAMGLTAKPAVKAGVKSADPEVAKRAAAVLDAIRKEQFWPRFAELLGDDADAKALFDAIRSVPRNVELIEAAEEKTEDVSKLYADRRAELNERCTNRSDPKRLVFHPVRVSAAEMAGFLYLGTFPGAADGKYARGGAENHFVMFFRDMWQNTAYPFSAALTKGSLKAGCGRLLVKWTETRTHEEELGRGLNGTIAFGLADVVPFAKAYARKVTADKPKYLPEPLLLALSAVGKLGAKDDFPLLMGFADDRTVVRRTFMTYPGDEKNPPREFRPGKDYSLELRDAAVVAALVLCGQSRERIDEYGFFASRYDPRSAGTPLPPVGKRRYADDPLTPGDLGFVRDEDREAAHKKARAWLAANAPPPPEPEDPKPADDPAALVKQLGSPAFADREAAEKKLKVLGVKAKAALKAGTADPDPEVAARSAAVRDAVRRDQLWPAFAAAAGGDPPARDLFDKMMASPRAADAAEAALDDPTRADELYRTRTAELLRVAAGHPPVGADRLPGRPPDPVSFSTPVPLGDVVGWLFLGTRQPGSGEWTALTHDRWGRVGAGTFPFLPEDDYKAADPTRYAYAAAGGAAMKKLTAAWLLRRREIDGLQAGLTVALRFDIPTVLGPARAVLRGQPPAADGPWARAVAVVLVGRHGVAADLPLLARLTADDRTYLTTGARPDDPSGGARLTCQVRDAAAVALCRLAGKDPAAFGFPPFPGTGPNGGRPLLGPGAVMIGFPTDADRAAAFARAAAWIKTFERPADPEPAKLVKQLGSPQFAEREAAEKQLRAMGLAAKNAVAAGRASADPEIARRCDAIWISVRELALADFSKQLRAATSGTRHLDHPVWRHYRRVAGDDPAARQLLTLILSDARRAKLLDDAADDPARANQLHAAAMREAARTWQENRDRATKGLQAAAADAAGKPGGLSGGVYAGSGRTGGQVVGSSAVTNPDPKARADYATLLFLGSFPPAGDTARDWDYFTLEMHYEQVLRDPGVAALIDRLYSNWLLQRSIPRVSARGWQRLAARGSEDAVPAARVAVAADGLVPSARGHALALIVKAGTPDDAVRLRKFLDDTAECNKDSVGNLTQVRDVAVAGSLLLAGREPSDFGFPNAPRFLAPGSRRSLFGSFYVGFPDETSRNAAHAKAKAWLAGQKK